MAIQLDSEAPTYFPRPKARLLTGLVRHVSAPARPQRTLDRFNSTARLRLARDEWRHTAQKHEELLLSQGHELQRQERAIAILGDQNANLRATHEEDESKSKALLNCLQNAKEKYDQLVDEFNDAQRSIAMLKKSDRAKGKVWQRNFCLKAAYNHLTSRSKSDSKSKEKDVQAALQEALAMAHERIEELETTGGVLLEALEKQNDSCGSDENEYEDHDMGAGVIEAEVAFRGVLEDETFHEQKEQWEYLLQE
ncbi:hypothetical protein FB567DRAFT_456588 [Paraphoma chrysanthemicola]|uniref:Uncharacterized protein n=1 Tax=Paraphoma chrysanthemicola TaxID=798071 RepID=A0A8K0QSX2_9PLEO|nr:hypothetical protein FB567DRAFT_456588 [Paraphoma chrysanthemicola]